jgi:hypothetical protein
MSKPPGFSKLIAVDLQARADAGAVQLALPACFARPAVSPFAAVLLYRCLP